VVSEDRQQHLGALGLQRADLVLRILQRLGDPVVEVEDRLLPVVVDVRGEDHGQIDRWAARLGERVVRDVR